MAARRCFSATSGWTASSLSLKLPQSQSFRVEYAVRAVTNGDPAAPAVVAVGPAYAAWTALADALAPEAASRMVAVSLFGNGGSGAWPRRGHRAPTLDDGAALVAAVCDAAGAEEGPRIVGAGFGGAVTLRYAATRPVTGVVAVEPDYLALVDAGDPFAGAAPEAARLTARDAARNHHARLVALSADPSGAAFRAAYAEFWGREADASALDEAHAAHGAFGAGARRDLVALAADGPKHIVAAPDVSPRTAPLAALAAVLEAAGFARSDLPAGGHGALRTHPAEAAAHLAPLLAGID